MASTDERHDPAFDVPPDYVADLFRLDGRVAVVTGGGSGLGAAMAKGLAQAGAVLAIVDVNEAGAASTVATIEEQGGRAISLPCDVTDKGQGDALVDRGVRVNAIGPGLCDSPLTRARAQQSSVTSDFIKARMLREELILPRELIGTAIFLASDASLRVTGHTVLVDDGYLTA